MLRRLFLAVATTFLFISAAHAGSGPLEGKWQQISSNAGNCKSCKIEIAAAGPSLNVTSSNGWAATLKKPKTVWLKSAEGTGEWRGNSGGTYAGKPFLAHFELIGSQLRMKMIVRMNDGSISTVEAAFQRQTGLDI